MFRKRTESSIITAVTIGSILEWYEVFLYIYWAPIISDSLFDYSSEFINLISTLVVFAVGFLSRPLGGLFFGYIGDKCGRKEALVISIIVSSLPSIVIAFLPSYTVWNYMSQVSLLLLRFLQGVPAGGELPGAICYLSESATHRRRKYMCSYSFVGAQIGGIIAMIECLIMESFLTHKDLVSWGWRVSFLVGGFLGLFGFYLRNHLEESRLFKHLQEKFETTKKPLHEAFHMNKERMLIGFLISIFEVVGYFIISVFPAVYFQELFKISSKDSLIITASLLTISGITIPFFGKFGQKHKSKPLLIISAIGVLLFCYPFYLAVKDRNLIMTLFIEVVFIFFLNIQFALLPSVLSALFPTAVRYTCLGFCFNVCDSIIGGLTPILAISLIKFTGNSGSFVSLFALSAIISLVTMLLIKDKKVFA